MSFSNLILPPDNLSQSVVELFVRIYLGILFFFQGYDKLFNIGVDGVIQTFRDEFENKRIPKWSYIFASYFFTFTELICGLLLILGFLRFYSLIILGLDLLFVGIAFSLIQPMWDMRHVFPRIVLLAVLFLFPTEWIRFTIDNLIFK